VVDVALRLVQREVVDALLLLPVPSVQSVSACVWPRVNRAEPCVRGITETSHQIGRISVSERPSGRRLSTAIFDRTISL
jgi:hypothetical protein